MNQQAIEIGDEVEFYVGSSPVCGYVSNLGWRNGRRIVRVVRTAAERFDPDTGAWIDAGSIERVVTESADVPVVDSALIANS